MILSISRVLRKRAILLLPPLAAAIFTVACTTELLQYTIEKPVENSFTILHISDLHLKKRYSYYEEVWKIVEETDPDVIVFTGDTIEKQEQAPHLEWFLDNIKKETPKLAIMGNWEQHIDAPSELLNRIFQNYSGIFLVNSGIHLNIRGEHLYFYGTDDLSGEPSLSQYAPSEESIVIILTHSPAYFDSLVEQLPSDEFITLSGHTHGGQVTLFGLPLYLPPGSRPYLKGQYIKEEAQLFVSKGVGYSSINIRFMAKRDIILYTFTPLREGGTPQFEGN